MTDIHAFACGAGSKFTHSSRFQRPPYDPVRSDFPSTVLTLAFPPKAFPTQVRLKRWLAYTLPVSVYLRVRPSRMAPPTHVVDHPGTAKCPELLCLSQALLASGWCHAPPRRALPLLPRSYELMRQTKFLRQNFVFHTYIQRSLQVAASPCWKVVLPDVISANLSQDAWALIPAGRRVHLPVSSPTSSAFPKSCQ